MKLLFSLDTDKAYLVGMIQLLVPIMALTRV